MRIWSLLFALAAVFAIGTFVYAPFSADWWLPNNVAEYDLRVMPPVDDVGALPTAGTRLIVVAPVKNVLHFRVFDVTGRMAVDTDETKLKNQDRPIEDLRKRLEGVRPPHVPSADEKARVLADVKAVVGNVPAIDPYHTASAFGKEIDSLFLIILWITGIVFVGTQIALVWASFAFADRPGRVSTYFHGSQRLEVIWTIIPAAILVFIALYQMGTWANIKFRSAEPKVPPLAEITARQFQWVMRYPGPDDLLHTADDVVLVNDLHFVKNKTALIYLKSSDVLHSFFLPQLRIKQDAVPGLTIPVWFDSDRSGKYELLCAELCGWGHYKMRSHVTIHETQSEFDEWMDRKVAEQNRSQLAAAAGPVGR